MLRDRFSRCAWVAAAAFTALVTCLSVSLAAAAQPTWKPEKALELVVPSAAGGGTDKTARLMQRIWQDRRALEVPVQIVNKSGGQGQVALNYLKGHAGDPGNERAHRMGVTMGRMLQEDVKARIAEAAKWGVAIQVDDGG